MCGVSAGIKFVGGCLKLTAGCVTVAECGCVPVSPGGEQWYTYGCTVSLPASLSWGSCINPSWNPPPDASVYVAFDGYPASIGGWRGTSSNSDYVVVFGNVDGGDGCAYNEVRMYLPDHWAVFYRKLAAGGVYGTYSLYSITYDGVACSLATADATITVSP